MDNFDDWYDRLLAMAVRDGWGEAFQDKECFRENYDDGDDVDTVYWENLQAAG